MVLGQAGTAPIASEELPMLGQALSVLRGEVEAEEEEKQPPPPPTTTKPATKGGDGWGKKVKITKPEPPQPPQQFLGLPRDLVAYRALPVDTLLELAAENTSTLIQE